VSTTHVRRGEAEPLDLPERGLRGIEARAGAREKTPAEAGDGIVHVGRAEARVDQHEAGLGLDEQDVAHHARVARPHDEARREGAERGAVEVMDAQAGLRTLGAAFVRRGGGGVKEAFPARGAQKAARAGEERRSRETPTARAGRTARSRPTEAERPTLPGPDPASARGRARTVAPYAAFNAAAAFPRTHRS
jgi:hypothetical protein